MSLRTLPILWFRQDRHFYFRLFLLSRKVSNATTKLPKAISKPIIPINIIIISVAVICTTSLPMYSGEPVSLVREATTLSWVLFHEKVLPQFDRNFKQICFYGIYGWTLISQHQFNITEKK